MLAVSGHVADWTLPELYCSLQGLSILQDQPNTACSIDKSGKSGKYYLATLVSQGLIKSITGPLKSVGLAKQHCYFHAKWYFFVM